MRCLCALHLLLLILCTTTAVIAQSTDATVSGLVLDPSGRVIPNADIEILNESTRVIYSGKTNETGIYTVSILPPGQYRLQVSKIGFKSLIKPGIVLNVQSAVALNFTLPIGATSETVTVGAGASLINTTDASVSTVVDRKFVENIPLNGRSFQDLISMTPGVVTQSPQPTQSLGYNGDFSVNGQRTESNYYIVDGVSANVLAGNGYGGPQAGTSGSLAASTALGTTQSMMSVDALQEFRVQSSTYSAEYGRSPGGQFSFVTRSGTNAYHGSAFDYIRNNYFDANDWFNEHNDKPIAALRQNDFGGTIGGAATLPHLYDGKERTFFFLSYEGLRLTQPQAASVLYVPDTFMRQEAPAPLQPILNAFPIQNGLDYGSGSSPGLAQFIEPYALPAEINSTSFRIDESPRANFSFFFRLGDTPSDITTRNLSSVTTSRSNTLTNTLGGTLQLPGSTSYDGRLGYARSDSSVTGHLDTFGGGAPVNLAEAMAAGNHSAAQPFVELYLPSVGFTNLSLADARNALRQWNTVNTLNSSRGRHQLKVGFDYRRLTAPTTPASPLLESIFESSQSVLNNAATESIIDNRIGATPVLNEGSAFIQDEWRLASSLHLSLGLRWEAAPPPTEAHGQDAYTLLGNVTEPESLTLAPRGTRLWKPYWYNFAPRAGVAWIPHERSGWETVVRAGGGVFFDTANEVAILGFSGLGFAATHYLYGISLPMSQTQVTFSPSITPPYTSGTIYAFPSHLQLPYTLQWTTSVQQALGRSQAMTLSYVGSNGRRLLDLQELSLNSLNSNFSSVLYVPNGITSNYQALQGQFQRSLSHGLQALASYTWSHSLDYGSESSALPTIRGNSDFDVRNNFSAALSWELPRITRQRLTAPLLDQWGLDARFIARNAFPITIQGNLMVDPATGNQFYGNLNLVSNQPLYLYKSQYPGGRAINPAAFTTPIGNSPGDAPRNFVRGFGETQLNIAFRREFPLYGQLRLQFRAEAFNVANHPNFGYVDPYLTDTTFGQATKMLNQSLGTVASQYQQGGPRSMQFALKVLF